MHIILFICKKKIYTIDYTTGHTTEHTTEHFLELKSARTLNLYIKKDTNLSMYPSSVYPSQCAPNPTLNGVRSLRRCAQALHCICTTKHNMYTTKHLKKKVDFMYAQKNRVA